MSVRNMLVATVTAVGALASGSAQAGVTVYTSASEFAAAASIQHTATFAGLAVGRTHGNPVTQDGIEFTQDGAVDLYVTGPGEALTQNPLIFATNALSAEGLEDFDIQLAAGGSFGAIGLDYITNRFGAPVLSLFDTSGILIGNFTVQVAPEHEGFFGLISTTPIEFATSIVDPSGIREDTAIDNVRIGSALGVGGVPEPASWALMISGFGLAGATLRRRWAMVAA